MGFPYLTPHAAPSVLMAADFNGRFAASPSPEARQAWTGSFHFLFLPVLQVQVIEIIDDLNGEIIVLR